MSNPIQSTNCYGREYHVAKKCEMCGKKNGTIRLIDGEFVKLSVELHAAATMYDWNGEGDDPNAPLSLCQFCADCYDEHWNEMWKEYRYSQLCL